MASRISAVTLAVRDLPRAAHFYRDGLGLIVYRADREPAPGADMADGTPALELRELSHDDRPRSSARRCGAITLGLFAGSPSDVDRLLIEAIDAGATLLRPGLRGQGGVYSGSFADLDGNRWEVRCGPRDAPPRP